MEEAAPGAARGLKPSRVPAPAHQEGAEVTHVLLVPGLHQGDLGDTPGVVDHEGLGGHALVHQDTGVAAVGWAGRAGVTGLQRPLQVRQEHAEPREHGVSRGEVGVEGAGRGVLTLQPALHIGADLGHNGHDVLVQGPGVGGAAGPVAVSGLGDASLAGNLGPARREQEANLKG